MGNKESHGITRRNFIVGTGAASLFLFMGGFPLLSTACSSKSGTIKSGLPPPAPESPQKKARYWSTATGMHSNTLMKF